MIEHNTKNNENLIESSMNKLIISGVNSSRFNSNNISSVIQENGHFFIKKTFHKPTYCHHCAEMLWGLIGQGFICEACNFICHEKCQKGVISLCSTIASNNNKDCMMHYWSEPCHLKRKFCNVCRKRLEDGYSIRCEICEYYVHIECQEMAISNCRDTSTFKRKDCYAHYHHWREGNLPTNSKCIVCRKTCWTSECLAGVRCEWCGITAHSYCRIKIVDECNFGSLRDIIIPPFIVIAPKVDKINKSLSEFQDTCLLNSELKFGHDNFNNKKFYTSLKVNYDKEKFLNLTDNNEKDIVKFYDGDLSFKNNIYQLVALSKDCTYQQIIEIFLKTFQFTGNILNYYLTVPFMNEKGLSEIMIDEKSTIKKIKEITHYDDLPILLRFKEKEDNEIISIKIHMESHNNLYGFQIVNFTSTNTVEDVIKNALEKFKLEDSLKINYRLVEKLTNNINEENILENDEIFFKLLIKRRKESLSQYKLLKFFLKDVETLPSISIFIGNLPNSLSQVQYEKILSDSLKNNPDLRWSKFDVIYYEYGSMVILYDDTKKAIKAYQILKETSFDDKPLTVLILPNIQAYYLPKNIRPLLVFVNVKSGGQQGTDLITSFRHLLNPHQVFDLQNGGPLPGLYVFRNIESYRILACGGDGTIGWVLSCLDNVSQDARCQSPPMSIVPLGTGNDLARVLRWGAGYTGAEEPINLLRDIIDAEEIILDRWTVVFHPDDTKELDDIKKQITNNINQTNTNEDSTAIYVMNNYFGIGIDADLCLDFHTAREENPNKFNSRLHNKKYYLQIGLRKIMNKGTCREFNRYVSLEVDGKKIDLPQIEGIIILNILSWGGGANPWGPEKDDQFQKPTHYDGMLEVVGIKGVVHMGQIYSGISGAIRLAQGGRVKIRMNSEIPVQVDGEPWLQTPCAITIIKSALKATMLKKSKGKLRRRNTEPSVNIGMKTLRLDNDHVYHDGDSEPF